MISLNIGEQTIALEQPEPGYLLGTYVILDVNHWIELYRVELREGGDLGDVGAFDLWEPEDGRNNNAGRLSALCEQVGDAWPATVEIPGVDGVWALTVFPYAC